MEAQHRRRRSRWLAELRYRFLGPTLVHLQYEFYLLCSTLLLTLGSMRGLYKASFGTYRGDYIFMVAMLTVLGRHLVFRILCTWDPSTHASPGVWGFFAHFVQAHACAGQTFDRPAPLLQQQLYQYYSKISSNATSGGMSSIGIGCTSGGGTGTTAPLPLPTAPVPPPISAADRMNQIVGGVLETREVSSWTQLVPSSLVYACQIPRQYIWFPVSRLMLQSQVKVTEVGEDNGKQRYMRNITESSTALGWLRRTYHSMQKYAIQPWIRYSLSLQCMLSTTVVIYFAEIIWLSTVGKTPLAFVFGDSVSWRLSSLTLPPVYPVQTQVMYNNSERGADKTSGYYDRLLQPTTFDVLLVLLGFGTMFSVTLVYRVILPLPDLVAGGHVAKDVARLRHHGLVVSTGGNGGSNSKTKKGHRNSVSSISSNNSNSNNEGQWWWMARILHGKDFLFSRWSSLTKRTSSETATFAERQCSIAAENRFQLSMSVVISRVFEYIVVVGLIPRSNFICRATGHCAPGPSLWERSRILYPGGFREPSRSVGQPYFDYMESDIASALWTILGVTIVSTILLLTQTIILNRTYLSINARHSLEWQLVEKKTERPRPGSSTAQHPEVPLWEHSRKYLKGELVRYPNAKGSLYRAMTNAPTYRPYDRMSLGLHHQFVTELGHPCTSVFVAELATYQVVAALLYFNAWIVLLLLGASTYGLFWAVAAHVIAAHGVLSGTTSAAPIGVSRTSFSKPSSAMRALQELNAEITFKKMSDKFAGNDGDQFA